MTYFRRRNKLIKEFSGYQEASQNLRSRLIKVINKYLSRSPYLGIGQENLWVRASFLEHELFLEFTESNIRKIIMAGGYEDVFTAVEIFLALAQKQASGKHHRVILPDVKRAFALSGSVYCVDDYGKINLRIEEDLAEDLEKTKDILEGTPSAYTQFFNAVGNLMGRKEEPRNIVRDVFVAVEDYLKKKTGKKDFGKAIFYLQKVGLITSTQKSLMDKLYAYRSNVYGSAHAGSSKTPNEIDALWYLETTIVQLKLLERRFNQSV